MSERLGRHTRRLIAGAALVGLAVGLSGCGGGGGGANTFDPTDWLDFLDQKKPLPGNRKPVFPEGVPGVEQGIPKDLYKGYQEQQSDAAPPVPAEPEPAKPRSRHASKPAPAAQPDAGADDGAAASPPPKKQVTKRKRTTAPPPDDTAAPSPPPAQQPVAQPAPAAPVQQQPAPFPAPLPSGSFSR